MGFYWGIWELFLYVIEFESLSGDEINSLVSLR
jgi:hypothetical protein